MRPTSSVRCSRRTAPRYIRRNSCAGSQSESNDVARRSTKARRSPRSRRIASTPGNGVVRADVVVRATEGYTPTIRGYRRALAPVYSLMLATEPLPKSFWDDAGLRERETFNDLRHLIIYGQRTCRRSTGVRRTRRALPLRLARRTRVRQRARGLRCTAQHRRRAVPCVGGRHGHSHVGRATRRPA